MEKAIERQRVLLQHLRPSSSASSLENLDSSLAASVCLAGDSSAYHRTSVFGDDVVIVAAHRTAICKAKRGGFKDTFADDLLAPVLKAVIEKTNVNPSEVRDIVVGTVLAPGSQRASECRMAAFYAGFPETVPIRILNMQCSSGLQAVADVAAAIKAGFYDIGIGVEIHDCQPYGLGGISQSKSTKYGTRPKLSSPHGYNFRKCCKLLRRNKVDSHRKAAAATAS